MSSGSKHLVGKTAQLGQKWTQGFRNLLCSSQIQSSARSQIRCLLLQFHPISQPHPREVIRREYQLNLRHDDIGSCFFARLPEQRRIVAKIEKRIHPAGRGRRGAQALAGQPAALPCVGAQGRVRGPAGTPGSADDRPEPPAGAHPGRAAREVGGGASGEEVRRAGPRRRRMGCRVTGGVVLGKVEQQPSNRQAVHIVRYNPGDNVPNGVRLVRVGDIGMGV